MKCSPTSMIFAVWDHSLKHSLSRSVPDTSLSMTVIEDKAGIKTTSGSRSGTPADPYDHHDALEAWWNVARNDFAQLSDAKTEMQQKMPMCAMNC